MFGSIILIRDDTASVKRMNESKSFFKFTLSKKIEIRPSLHELRKLFRKVTVKKVRQCAKQLHKTCMSIVSLICFYIVGLVRCNFG